MSAPNIVSQEQWLQARKELLAAEKAHTKAREALTRKRQQLPWVQVKKAYTFDGPAGAESLADLFEDRSQLIVYHFMFDPAWDEGCKSCSLMAEHYDRLITHIQHRDTTFVTVSTAPLQKLETFKTRMGWTFKWVSSGNTDFNRDYDVTFTPEQKSAGEVRYNFGPSPYFSSEGPGLSVFAKDDDGTVYHTYSVYARGLENFLTVYDYLDIVPKGRDEQGLPHGMAWVRLRDRYED